MKTMMLILTMQMVAVAKILLAYLGISELSVYLNLMNALLIAVYSIMLITAFILFLKEQKNVHSR